MSSENEATLEFLSNFNKVEISNVISKKSPHAAWGGFISLVEEDENFIVSVRREFIFFMFYFFLKTPKVIL